MSDSKNASKKEGNVTNLTDILQKFERRRSGSKTEKTTKKQAEDSQDGERKFYDEADDPMWVQYIQGTNSTELKHKPADPEIDDTVVDTDNDTASDTLKKKKRKKGKFLTYSSNKESKEKQPALPTLDSTHTASETQIFSIMYRSTISNDVEEGYFSIRGLMKATGIGSPNTVRKALEGLELKRSIELADEKNTSPNGTKYRIHRPKDIFKLRENYGIKIDGNTKKVLSIRGENPKDTVSLSVSSSVSEGVSKIDTATVSKTDTAKQDTLYIKNKYTDDFLKSSSNIKNIKQNNDVSFDHKTYVMSLFRNYTGAKWTKEDDAYYETLRNILPTIIECGIISAILRTPNQISSFSDCDGCIQEFSDNCPPGYINYLRKKFQEEKHQEIKGEEPDKFPVLKVPTNSIFTEDWLTNHITNFKLNERNGIIRLAERFDYFMLKNEDSSWIKNPTGTFVEFIRGNINLKLPEEAPTFDERVGMEIKLQDLEERQKKREQVEKKIKDAISSLTSQEKDKFIKQSRRKYGNKLRINDSEVLDDISFWISHDSEQIENKSWKDIFNEIKQYEDL